MSYLKHNSKNPNQEPSKTHAEKATTIVVTGPESAMCESTPPIQHEINHVEGIDGIEASLDWLAKGLARLTSEDFSVNLTLAQGSNIYPIKLTFADNDFDDTMGRLVTAIERIADSLARMAGLSRPRLEQWHDQDQYMPRYRDTSVNGGAPGPSTEVTEKSNRCNGVNGQPTPERC